MSAKHRVTRTKNALLLQGFLEGMPPDPLVEYDFGTIFATGRSLTEPKLKV